MELKALNKVHSRLRVAKKAVDELETCTNFDAFNDIWYVFLVSAKNIYTVLKQGAKITPQCRQWFGARNQERLSDPLLRYITEARNDDEHGLEPMGEYVPPEINMGVSKPGYSNAMVDQYGNTYIGNGTAVKIIGTNNAFAPKLRALDKKPIAIEEVAAHIKLIPVRDRSKSTLDPPSSHLGQPVVDQSPLNVARLMLAYLIGLVKGAEGFRTP